MNFSVSRSAVVLAAVITATPMANAAIFTFTGDTTGKATFARPEQDLLSTVSEAVNYESFKFTVNVSGEYSFLTTGTYDTFSVLYGGTFSPSSPLTNSLVASDDIFFGFFNASGFVEPLTAGASYTLVTTGYSSAAFGAYSVTIGGPGMVTAAIPEPSTYVLMGLGLGLVGLLRRRDNAQNA